jgi:hypothetical protein
MWPVPYKRSFAYFPGAGSIGFLRPPPSFFLAGTSLPPCGRSHFDHLDHQLPGSSLRGHEPLFGIGADLFVHPVAALAF